MTYPINGLISHALNVITINDDGGSRKGIAHRRAQPVGHVESDDFDPFATRHASQRGSQHLGYDIRHEVNDQPTFGVGEDGALFTIDVNAVESENARHGAFLLPLAFQCLDVIVEYLAHSLG